MKFARHEDDSGAIHFGARQAGDAAHCVEDDLLGELRVTDDRATGRAAARVHRSRRRPDVNL